MAKLPCDLQNEILTYVLKQSSPQNAALTCKQGYAISHTKLHEQINTEINDILTTKIDKSQTELQQVNNKINIIFKILSDYFTHKVIKSSVSTLDIDTNYITNDLLLIVEEPESFYEIDDFLLDNIDNIVKDPTPMSLIQYKLDSTPSTSLTIQHVEMWENIWKLKHIQNMMMLFDSHLQKLKSKNNIHNLGIEFQDIENNIVTLQRFAV